MNTRAHTFVSSFLSCLFAVLFLIANVFANPKIGRAMVVASEAIGKSIYDEISCAEWARINKERKKDR